MKRIAIFQVDLAVGGIQRSLINLLNSIDYSKLYVDLYLFTNDKFYEESLPKEVNITYLNKLNKINKIVPFSILKYLLLQSIVIVSGVYVWTLIQSAPHSLAILIISLALSILPAWFADISAIIYVLLPAPTLRPFKFIS